MAERTCPHCGGRFEQTGRGRPRQWCYECLPAYDQADHVAYTRRSAALQAFKLTGRHFSCCGIEPAVEPWTSTWAIRGNVNRWHGPLALCSVCHLRQVPTSQGRTCSEEECKRIYRNTREQAWRKTDVGRAWKKRHAHTHRRLTKVGNRDGWLCHICKRKVDPRLKFPHPLSGSVDHLVPRACGGSDDYANLALAHFKCNCAKGDRAIGEQLRLIG